MLNNESTRNCRRFSNTDVATAYPDRFRPGHPRDKREARMIELALDHLPDGASVLDLPCGSGRVARILLSKGFRVHCADLSTSMLKRARQTLDGDDTSRQTTGKRPGFSQQNLVNGTTFDDHQFDATFCHRLFHHLIEEETRIRALIELARISREFVFFSFFDKRTLGAGLKAMRDVIRGHTRTDRVPVYRKELIRETRAAHLEIIEFIPAQQGVSPLSIAVARPTRRS